MIGSSLRRTTRTQRQGAAAFTVLAALIAGAGVGAVATPAYAADTLTPYNAVNQFIGTQNDTSQNKGNSAYGNTYPGATLPFGMVQYNPTTFNTQGGALNGGGYEYEADQLRGFGLTRLSGTGCVNNNGAFDFPVLPYTGDLTIGDSLPVSPADNIKSFYLPFSHSNETSKPGDYSVALNDGTDVNLTATPRTGVATFDFPADKSSSTLVFDVAGSNNGSSSSQVHIDGNRVYGQTTTRTVCSGGTYTIYFSATFDQPITTSGTWTGSTVTAGSKDATSTASHGAGAFVSFAKGAKVTAKTGISYVSADNAALNATTETADKTAADVRADAKTTWEKALNSVAVTGGTDDARTKFYTALYHSLLHPNLYDDVNGEYFGYNGKLQKTKAGHHEYATYSGWDMYRGQAQLIAMAFPDVASDIAQSITDTVVQTGDWPNWPHNGTSQQKMTGDGLQVVLTELDAFGATDYDRATALSLLAKSRTLPSSSGNRTNLSQYVGLGFIENRNGGGATSTALEYAITDFATSQMADRMGEDKISAVFQARAQSWRNVFDASTGDIRPRERTGFDTGMNLGNRDDGSGRNQFDQSTGYQYGWLVPQDVAGLIEARGGKAAATADLDEFFTEVDRGVYDTKFAYLSNEGDFQTPWIYNWLQQPAKATDVLDRAVNTMYNTTPKGLPGNDDLGALSSWYVWANIGLYPSIYGTAELSASSPMFEHVEINSTDSKRDITIDAPEATTKRYIQSATVNGAASTASFYDEDITLAGATIAYTMGTTAGVWGTKENDVPPSYDEAANVYNNIGTTPAAASNTGMLDATFHSLSRDELATKGAAPGQQIPFTGTDITFQWPNTNAGAPDNWIPHGQVLEMDNVKASSVSFLGLATNGPSQGTAKVVYTDGSTQDVLIQFTDWTPASNSFGNTTLVSVSGRNVGNAAKDGTAARVFGTVPVELDPKKTVTQVILPKTVSAGIMHVFDVAFGTSALAGPDETPERVILSPSATPATSQFVTWRSRAAEGTVEWRTAGSTETAGTAKAEVVDSKTGDKLDMYNMTGTMTGLNAATKYEYRVGGGETWSDWAPFTTASDKAEPFSFLYFGDAQEGLTTAWPAILKAANEAYPDSRASIYAGDLINNATQTEWTQWFDATKKYGASQQNFNVIGNHQYNSGNDLLTIDKDSFEYPDNGPRAADAGADAAVWGEHLQKAMKDNVYYVDYQGVRFVTLNANRDNICTQIIPAGMDNNDANCAAGRKIWVAMQATWLDRILTDNPMKWTVTTQHQPIYSVSAGRDEADVRASWGPIMEKHNVDLVLAGHDHTYGRGYNDADKTDISGVTTGPVYAVADAGTKFYELAADADNVWTKNGATLVKKAVQTSTFQGITVDGDTLKYESTIAWVGDSRAAGAIGDTLDSFTITKDSRDGTKFVTEAGVDVPDKTLTSVVPTITGTAKVGETLTAASGDWAPAPVELSYQWLVGGDTVEGATDTTFRPRLADVGKTVTVEVTGKKDGYTTATETSTATDKVAPGELSGAAPTISGTVQVGKTLTLKPGTWESDIALTYQWLANGKPIAGATSTTLVVPAALHTLKLSATVTGTREGYDPLVKTSATTAAVKAGTLTAPSAKIRGTAKAGAKLTALHGTWTKGTTFSYRWYVNGKAISGATKVTYTVPKSAKGKKITVHIKGSLKGYVSLTRTSASKVIAK